LEFAEKPQQRLQSGIGLAAVLRITQGRHGDVELLGELHLRKPDLPPDFPHIQ